MTALLSPMASSQVALGRILQVVIGNSKEQVLGVTEALSETQARMHKSCFVVSDDLLSRGNDKEQSLTSTFQRRTVEYLE